MNTFPSESYPSVLQPMRQLEDYESVEDFLLSWSCSLKGLKEDAVG
jgi:hypothetical protein